MSPSRPSSSMDPMFRPAAPYRVERLRLPPDHRLLLQVLQKAGCQGTPHEAGLAPDRPLPLPSSQHHLLQHWDGRINPRPNVPWSAPSTSEDPSEPNFPDHFLKGRVVQKLALVWSRGPAEEETVLSAVREAREGIVRWVRPFLPGPFRLEGFAEKMLRVSYQGRDPA